MRKDYVIQDEWTLAEDLLVRPKWQEKDTVGLIYTLNSDTDSYIVTYDGRGNERIIVPEKYEGKYVTEIGSKAFSVDNSHIIESISLPRTIVEIGEYAFSNCVNLVDIKIPIATTIIGKSAFDNCSSLERIELPSGLTEIKNSTFANCTSLINVTFTQAQEYSIKRIGEYAFYNAKKLKSITIPNNVNYIGNYAFFNCESLEKIELADTNVRVINTGTFRGCRVLASVTIRDIVRVEVDAFRDCERLNGITFNNSLIFIGSGAFSNCLSLNRFFIPNSVRTIQQNAFLGCRVLDLRYNLSSIPSDWRSDWNLKEIQPSGTKIYHEYTTSQY